MKAGPTTILSCSCEFFCHLLVTTSAGEKGQILTVASRSQCFRRGALRPYSGPGGLLGEGRQLRHPTSAAGGELPAPE